MEMSADRWERVKSLYGAALERDPELRDDFVQRNAPDEAISQEVRRLLAEHAEAGSFLSGPVLPGPQWAGRITFVPGTLLAGRFRIVRFVAAGGMGEVYEAEDLELRESLAIKTIRPEISQQDSALVRFKREVQLARKVTHPNVCRVFDLFSHMSDEGSLTLFVSMELLRGETLSQRLHRVGRLASAQAFPIVKQIAAGLDAAHRVGVVHRDLKPGNVLLEPDEEQDGVRSVITDFGLAFRTRVDGAESLTVTASQGIFGTPAYMSPEQIEGGAVTKQADIYALGLILYEMVTGQQAFAAETPIASAVKRLSERVISPKHFAPELSPAWERTILRCLERQPSARFSTAIEVIDAISDPRFSALSRGQRSGLFAPRHSVRAKRNVWVSGLFALLLIAIGATLYSLRRHKGFEDKSGQPTHKPVTFVGTAYEPSISPDGSLIAYIDRPLEGNQRLVLQALSGGPTLELQQQPYLEGLHWSPDGSLILFTARDEDLMSKGSFLISRLGGAARSIGDASGGYCWSTDGSKLELAFRTFKWDRRIVVMNYATGRETEIQTPNYGEVFSLECDSKTRELLIGIRTAANSYQLWLMHVDGNEQRKILEESKAIDSAAWSSDSSSIYYMREEGETVQLVKLSLSREFAKAQILVTGLEAGDHFGLSGDGKRLVYTRTKSQRNLWRADLRGSPGTSQARPLTSGTLGYGDPRISPDGRWVVFDDRYSDHENIYKMPIEGGSPIQLTFFDAANVDSPAWAPDGSQVAFISNEGGPSKVWIVDARGGTPRAIDNTDTMNTYNRLVWFPSRRIVYQKPGMHNLMRLNPTTQQAEPLLPSDVRGELINRANFSHDGKWLSIALRSPERTGMLVLDAETGSERFFYPGRFYAFGWTADNKSVYAIRTEEGNQVYQMKIGTRQPPKSILRLPGRISTGAVGPAGRELIVNVFQETSDVWLMTDFDEGRN